MRSKAASRQVGRMHGSLLISILSFVMFGASLPALAAQDPHEPASPTTLAGPAREAVVRFVLEQTLRTPVQPIRGLVFGGDRPKLAALGGDGKVRVWNAVTGDLLQSHSPTIPNRSLAWLSALMVNGLSLAKTFPRPKSLPVKSPCSTPRQAKRFVRSRRITGKWKALPSARMAIGWPPAIGTARYV